MIQFYYCKRFVKNIENKDFQDIIYNKISENINRADLKNTGSISCFTGSIYALKTSNPRTRVIIEENNININNEEIKVFFVRDIILNKNFDHTYGKIIFPQLKSGEWLKNNPLSDEDKKNFIEKYNKEKVSITNKRELPPQELTAWLKDFKLQLNNEIFETENWVKYALSNSITDGMIDKYVDRLRLVIQEIINNKPKNTEILKKNNDIEIKKYISRDVGIIFSEIFNDATDKNIYLLHGGALIEHQSDYWNEQIKKIKSDDIDFENNLESISRKAFRSYPKWTINKDELWFAIQKSKEISNLSLTNEQIIFFKGFKFPYYINGQAGSGKSTMLYYLFANSYYYKCFDEIKDDIIFLTENETLLKLTKNSVFDLLTNNPEFSGLSTAQKNQSKNFFNSFKNFLLKLLPEDDKTKFKEKKYLDFSKFKQLYENSYLSKVIIDKYSAEEVWFTITTYIYGYNNEIVTSNNYLKVIPNKSQLIPLPTFKGIEEKVLPFYKKLISEEGYWDKLKIIRYINENININKKYSVLICDEAQDFCRVELRFILRLSKYLEYDLSNTGQVPIVFAGDPNQTVNPTGFRQDEMTSMLYEELQEIAKFKYSNEVNVYNPSFNYRSTQPVVSIANFVQYHRMKNLGIKQVRPQKAKRPNSEIDKDFNIFINYKTINNNEQLQKDLIEKLEYKIFIVPVNTQEKDVYINNHNLLSSINKVEVKTAVEAKGAEYEQVVLFGFGEYFIQNFDSLSQNRSDIEEQFRRSFYFNKLYVGLTRAQTELIIIDSERSENLFWKQLINNVEITSEKWEILNNFKEKTIEYNPETINSIIKSTPEDALINAERDKEQGLYDKNTARLKVAANQFFKIGKKEAGYECLALSEQIKENWLSAAELYLKPIFSKPKYEEASICLFKGRHFNKLVSLIGNNLKTKEQDLRLIISRIIDGEKIMKQDIDILLSNKESLYKLIKNLEWRDDLISHFIISSKTIEISEQKRDFVEVLEHIATSSDIDLWIQIGNIRFNLKDYQKAIDAWTEIDFYEKNEKYCISQIELSKQKGNYKDTIIWLDALLEFKNFKEKQEIYNEIIQLYKNNINDDDDIELYLIVYKILIMQYNNIDIIELGVKVEQLLSNTYSKLTKLKDFYENILKEEKLNKQVANYVIERWIKTIFKLNKLFKQDNVTININELNSVYLKFSKKHNLLYKAFDIEELKDISDFPQHLKQKPTEKFQKFTVYNFRKFQKLSLSNIGQFNLIVGDNNVGKTSLLEALLFTEQNNIYFRNIAFSFVERKKITKVLTDNKEKYLIPTNFFINEFIRKDANPKELKFEISENRHSWNYKIRPTNENEIKLNFNNAHNIDKNDYLNFIYENQKTKIIDLPLIIKQTIPEKSIKSPYIPFGKGFGKDLALIYYENIERIKSEREKFIQSMKVFIPNIERINVNTEKGEIDIEEKDFDVSAPLHQYGEGANKLFRILVQITLQKGKRLLIDEIDAGIHYSHFPVFWKTIINVADKNEVQIFATTHNIECVKHFTNILKEENYIQYQNLSRIITLRELPDKNIKAYTRTFEEFEYELDNEFELRGGDL